jgi:carbonic anhydrase
VGGGGKDWKRRPCILTNSVADIKTWLVSGGRGMKNNQKRRLPVRLAATAAVLGLAIIVFYACVSTPKAEGGTGHWSYTGNTGPAYWHILNPEYAIAKDGKAQSPVDIVTTKLNISGEGGARPVIAYQKTQFEVENNGHTIELTPLAYDNKITLDGDAYILQQFHFHSPSEHTVDKQSFPMELHLVHKNADGNLAVLGFLIKEGKENEVLKETFAALPKEVTHEGAEIPAAVIDLSALFDDGFDVYRYQGSLTTPPCTEGVKWIVAAKPIELSAEQVDAFEAVYSGNNRPVQKLNGRIVYFIDK